MSLRVLAFVSALLLPVVVSAQLKPGGPSGIAMGHVHLLVSDVEAQRKLWAALGGTPVQNGPLQLIQFPGVFVMLRQGAPTGGTVGSSINHFGFHVKDVKSSMVRWQGAGVKVESGALPGQVWIMLPDDIRVEILEDATQAEPIAMHHVHWNTASSLETQAWYAKHFGAVPGKRAQFDAADLPGANLTFTQVQTPVAPTRGRALDHIGFEVRDLKAFVARLEAGGVRIEAPIRQVPNSNVNIAFLTDPWGTYIELTENLSPARP